MWVTDAPGSNEDPIPAAPPSPFVATKKKKYQCPYCPYSFTQSDAQWDHKAHAHGDGELPICDLCNLMKDFASMKSLQEHQKIQHHGERKHHCPYVATHGCKFKGCNSIVAFKEHLKHNHGEGVSVQCTKCKKKFGGLITLLKPMKLGYCDLLKNFQCKRCNKVYKDKSSLNQHIHNVHEFTAASASANAPPKPRQKDDDDDDDQQCCPGPGKKSGDLKKLGGDAGSKKSGGGEKSSSGSGKSKTTTKPQDAGVSTKMTGKPHRSGVSMKMMGKPHGSGASTKMMGKPHGSGTSMKPGQTPVAQQTRTKKTIVVGEIRDPDIYTVGNTTDEDAPPSKKMWKSPSKKSHTIQLAAKIKECNIKKELSIYINANPVESSLMC